jgi:hypothetical protein
MTWRRCMDVRMDRTDLNAKKAAACRIMSQDERI